MPDGNEDKPRTSGVFDIKPPDQQVPDPTSRPIVGQPTPGSDPMVSPAPPQDASAQSSNEQPPTSSEDPANIIVEPIDTPPSNNQAADVPQLDVPGSEVSVDEPNEANSISPPAKISHRREVVLSVVLAVGLIILILMMFKRKVI